MRRAAIVAPVRTAVGTFGGSLRPAPVEDLGARVVKAVLDRTGLAPELSEDVVFAKSYAMRDPLRRPLGSAACGLANRDSGNAA